MKLQSAGGDFIKTKKPGFKCVHAGFKKSMYDE